MGLIGKLRGCLHRDLGVAEERCLLHLHPCRVSRCAAARCMSAPSKALGIAGDYEQ